MKHISLRLLGLALLFTLSQSAMAATLAKPSTDNAAFLSLPTEVREALTSDPAAAMDKFLSLTPAEYKKMTGQRLGLKNTIALKAAQHKMRKEIRQGGGHSPSDMDKTLYIVLAILIPFVAVGIATDWKGSNWVVCLLLTFLCVIPGIIYALIKMKDYYG